MRKIVIYSTIGILLLIIVIAVKTCGGSGALEITTEKAEKRNIIQTVSANGKIQPEVEVKISSDVSGEIIELLIKEGDLVKKGDVLAKINPDIYQSTIERMTASVNTAKANLANSKAQLQQVLSQFTNAQGNFNRQKKLFDQGAISQADFDNATAQFESAKANYTAAEENVKASESNVMSALAALKEANDNLRKTTITSPVNGKVIKLSVEKGERVVGTSQMSGTEMMVIANSEEMEVSVDVNESDIIRVHLNDTAEIEVDAYLDRKFKGIVTEIANSANTNGLSADQVTNFTVKIRILQSSYKDLTNPFRRGMTATVDIQTQRAYDVVSIPITAVTTRIDSSLIKKKKEDITTEGETVVIDEKQQNKKEEKLKPQECVFLYIDGKAKLVKVKTGIQNSNYIEIIDGLKDGDEVISGPYTAVSKLIRDGQKVDKTDEVDWGKKK